MSDIMDPRVVPLRDTAADIAAQLREEAERHWKLYLATGVLCVLSGVFSILVPVAASISAAVLVGWALLFGGVFQLLHAFRRDAGWDMAIRLVVAVLTVIAGIWLLLAPLAGTITLTIVLVAWLWATGAIRLAEWWHMRGLEGSWTLALHGLLNILLGALIWADFPSSAAWAIGLLVGISLLLWGIDLIFLAVMGRRLARAHA
jgi:uncharacterized membrane protein HdeD (DUF308 family)